MVVYLIFVCLFGAGPELIFIKISLNESFNKNNVSNSNGPHHDNLIIMTLVLFTNTIDLKHRAEQDTKEHRATNSCDTS